MTRAIRSHMRDFIAVVGVFALAVAIGGYILSEQRLRFPVVEDKPFQVWMEVQNAAGVMPGQGQTVRVAGMRVGDVGTVKLVEGRARIRLDLDREYKDLVRRDATVLSRPRTGLKDMFMALEPGSKSEPQVKEGGLIRVNNTLPDVNPDEILRMLDTDSRGYLKLLINGAGKGLQGRSGDLREVFRRLGPLHRDMALLNREVVKRKANFARLIHNYGSTISRLGREDEDLRSLVSAGSRVFGRLAREDQRISLAVSRLPSALRQTEDTLRHVREFGEVAGPAFQALRRPMRRVDDANRELLPMARRSEPILRKKIRPFVRRARPFVRDLSPAVRDLNRAQPDLRESFFGLNRLFNIAAYNPGGAEGLSGDPQKDRARDEGLLFWLGWASHNGNSVYNTSDAHGPFRRLMLLATCSTYDNILQSQFGTNAQLGAAVLGVKDLLLDPTLCG